MEHLVDHLQNDLGATLQREHAVIPESVVQRSADVDEIKLVGMSFVSKRLNDTAFSVTDDRRVISDCIDGIENGSCLVPLSVDREIQQDP